MTRLMFAMMFCSIGAVKTTHRILRPRLLKSCVTTSRIAGSCRDCQHFFSLGQPHISQVIWTFIPAFTEVDGELCSPLVTNKHHTCWLPFLPLESLVAICQSRSCILATAI